MKPTIFACLLALGGIGCAPQSMLVHQTFVGEQLVRTTVTPSGTVVDGGERSVALQNMYNRICDVQDDGEMANCKESLVLEEIYPRRSTITVEGRR